MGPGGNIAEAWIAASEIVAVSYGVAVDKIHAEGMGRGHRPPAEARLPKKVALFLAVQLCGCDYAELARHLALHRDTVAAHCAELRDRCAEDPELETRVDALRVAAAGRLAAAPRKLRDADEGSTRAMLLAAHTRFDRIEAALGQLKQLEMLERLAAFLNPTLSGSPPVNPTTAELKQFVTEKDEAA